MTITTINHVCATTEAVITNLLLQNRLYVQYSNDCHQLPDLSL